MVTLGVDLASLPRRTAACRIRWASDRADVDVPEANIEDAWLLKHAAEADRVGVDVPFGWPDAFIHAISAHHAGAPWPTLPITTLRFRETDRFVRDQVGWWPLSVSSEKIGVTAMRAAGLLSKLAARGEPVDRTGKGRWVEVYPAAALRRWGLSSHGYKGPGGRDRRRDLLHQLESLADGWLRLRGEARGACEASDHCFDAMIAALVARAVALGLCEPIPVESAALADKEGWIALPKAGSLQVLA